MASEGGLVREPVRKEWCVICDGYCKRPAEHTDEDRHERAQKYRFLRYSRPVAPSGARCGTLAGRGAHERLGEPICEACKAERRRYAKERYWQQKGLQEAR